MHWAGDANECDDQPQRWVFDLERFQNDEVPGETRVFNVRHAGVKKYDRFEFIFYGEDRHKGFSVNLSGLILYGEVPQLQQP